MDFLYQTSPFSLSEIKHHYGSNVHLLSSPMVLSYLSKLGDPRTEQPLINDLVEFLYAYLFDAVVDSHFPKKNVKTPTRMIEHHPEGYFEGEIIDPTTKCVSVDLARAGTFPSHLCYGRLNHLLTPKNVRQDHFYVARVNDEKGHVIGVNVSGSKIGGDIEQAIVLFPDPMGATGGTIVEAYTHYKNKVGGRPLMMIAMHLIITPEYLKRVTTECPDLKIFALRLDRGLSPAHVLKEVPGKMWNEEIGLNQHQYIVPGAGGLGEILNNSYC